MKRKLERYREAIDTAAGDLPTTSNANKYRNVARALGISTQAIKHRLANPNTIKEEHVLAAEQLARQVTGCRLVDDRIEEIESLLRALKREVFNHVKAMT